MNPKILELRHVSIIRGSKQVLTDINWSIAPGEHWVLMGPNGCGKSTLLEIASGYRWPTDGEVCLLGGKLGEVFLPDLRTKIGFITPWVIKHTQGYVPVEHVIASGLDASIGYVDKISPQTLRKIRQQLKFFEAEDLLGRPFGKLSSGEKLKVVMCRGLINNPALLILDEPFAHLDMTTRYHSYEMLKKLTKSPKSPSMILVTHYMEDIQPFFTHALLLKEGKVQASGKIKAILKPKILNNIFNISI